MLGEFFYWVFNMSIIASLTGLIILLIRTIRRIPRQITTFLWIVPFFRMCIPVGLNSSYSLMSLISHFTSRSLTIYQPADDIEFTMTNMIMAANSYFPITYKIKLLDRVFDIASVIWVIVSLAIVLALGILYLNTMYEMKTSVHLRDNIYLSDKILSPAVYGVIRPRIILPSSYATKDIQYILKHEKMHIRRADNLWRILVFLVVSIHWFNPLSWLFLKLFLTDIELSCDECVLKNYNNEQAKEYALALIEGVKSKNMFTSAFGGAKIRTRVENILSFKRMTWISFVGFSALVTTIISVLLTNAG